jgi:hypothetical protein
VGMDVSEMREKRNADRAFARKPEIRYHCKT